MLRDHGGQSQEYYPKQARGSVLGFSTSPRYDAAHNHSARNYLGHPSGAWEPPGLRPMILREHVVLGFEYELVTHYILIPILSPGPFKHFPTPPLSCFCFLFLFFACFGVHTWLCSGIIPGFMHRDYSLWAQETIRGAGDKTCVS